MAGRPTKKRKGKNKLKKSKTSLKIIHVGADYII